MQKTKYIYYRCSGFKGKCPERFVRQEVLDDHFTELLRRLACSSSEFDRIRKAFVELCDSRVAAAKGTGAAIESALALLDTGCRAHQQFGIFSNEQKRQMLDLILADCTWANGHLSAEFVEPFASFARLIASLRWRQPEPSRADDLPIQHARALLARFERPTPVMCKMAARYEAWVSLVQAENPMEAPPIN